MDAFGNDTLTGLFGSPLIIDKRDPPGADNVPLADIETKYGSMGVAT
jgi:hypothetical protein